MYLIEEKIFLSFWCSNLIIDLNCFEKADRLQLFLKAGKKTFFQ